MTDAFHHGNLKHDALEVGLKIIETDGYQKVEIKKIAAACGVSSPSIYRHFKNKDALMMALLTRVSAIFHDYLYCVDNRTPVDELVEMGIKFIHFSYEYKHYFEFLFNSEFVNKVISDGQNMTVAMDSKNSFSLFKKTVKRYLVEINAKGNFEMHVINLWSYISGLALISDNLEVANKEQQLAVYVRKMIEIYTNGISNC